MSPNEALDLLGLDPSAKPAQIKEAYRDLVKVWHPDRFGNDPRLRQKAETKLAELNEAFQILQNPDTSRRPQTQPQPPKSPSSPKRSQSSWTFVIPRRLYPPIALVILFLVGYLTLRYFAAHPPAPPHAPATPQPVAVQPPSKSPKPASTHPQPTPQQPQTVESICAPIKNSRGDSAYVHCLEQLLNPPKNPQHAPPESAGNNPTR